MKSFLPTVIRPLFHGVWLFTSVYCLLAYVPFTYRQVLAINLLPWLSQIANLQPWLLLSLTVLLVFSIFKIEKKRNLAPEDRRELFFLLGATVLLTFWDLPKQLTNDGSALAWSLATLIPVFWLAFFDLRNTSRLKTQGEASWVLILCALISGGVTSVAVGYAYQGMKLKWLFPGIGLSLLAASIFCLFEQIFRQLNLNLEKKFRGYGLIVGFTMALFLTNKVCAAISLFGAPAIIWSIAFGCATGLAMAGQSMQSFLRRPSSLQNTNEDLTGLFIFSEGLPLGPSKLGQLFFWIFWIGLIFWVSQIIPKLDWNGLIQQAVITLLLSIGFFKIYVHLKSWSVLTRRDKDLNSAIVAFLALYILGVLFFLHSKPTSDKTNNPLFAMAESSFFSRAANTDFYQFLQGHMNLSSQLAIQLAEAPLAEKKIESTLPNRPHIFILVIDSLRQDYLKPYNSEVTFTPEINRFSEDAFVFKKAFTRFGATGLSEPSIWAGRFLPHKMYPKPFAPVNTLEKLIKAEDYLAWISRDSILKEILSLSESNQDLDSEVSTQDLEFCRTTRQIIERFKNPDVQANKKPVFVYSQSQNIHISVLAGKKKRKTKANTFADFDSTYATEVEKVDACFGQFIQGLKSLGLYDNSIVVLTADHGDSLGENGRYGHAYTIFPEIMRIPLLISLPSKMRTLFQTNLDRLVFSTDLAPSLGFLLGRSAQATHWSEGQSFFSSIGTDLPVRLESDHLVMSSYGPVAGLLSNQGDTIYISDAVNFIDEAYTINKKGASSLSLTSDLKLKNEKIIREKILDLYNYFNIQL